MMQALVIAHASYGHNSFFKGNYLFRQFTQADAILDYLVFARRYVMECEQRYGMAEVEEMLDSCHALMEYGVDRYKRPAAAVGASEKRGAQDRASKSTSAPVQRPVAHAAAGGAGVAAAATAASFPAEPEENILYFVEKHSPRLAPWQRELVRIVRKLAQYFYPQTQTKVMNEGWATFWHYTLAQPPVRKEAGERCVHDRVPAQPHQRGHAARLRSGRLSRHEPLRAGLRHDAGHPPHLRAPHRRGSRLVSRAGRTRLAQESWISRCATSRTSRSSRSICRRA